MGENSLGRMIKRGRESLGFSQARLGELVGRSATTIRNWERGKSTPSVPSDAVALAAVLGLDERRVVEAAGFEPADLETHQTVEQAYASLAPEQSDAPEPVGDDAADEVGEEEYERAPATSPEEAEEREEDRQPEAAGPTDLEPDAPEPPWQESEPSSPPSPPPGRRLTAVPAAPESEPREDIARAAPPTILETTPAAEPSYLEDPDERQRYRARALATAAVVIFLVLVLLWSFGRVVDAAGTMWDDFTGMLEL